MQLVILIFVSVALVFIGALLYIACEASRRAKRAAEIAYDVRQRQDEHYNLYEYRWVERDLFVLRSKDPVDMREEEKLLSQMDIAWGRLTDGQKARLNREQFRG